MGGVDYVPTPKSEPISADAKRSLVNEIRDHMRKLSTETAEYAVEEIKTKLVKALELLRALDDDGRKEK